MTFKQGPDWIFHRGNREFMAFGWLNNEIQFSDNARRFVFSGRATFTIEYMSVLHERHSFE